MIVEHDLDAVAIYGRERRALVEALRTLTDEELQTPVPATPGWDVGDVLRHLAGIAADLNAGNFGDGDPDAWTAAQIERRRDATVAQVAAEWESEAGRSEEGLRLFGYELASHYVGDLLQHACDVHAALGRPCPAPQDALVAGLDFYVDSLHHALIDAGVGPLCLDVGDDEEQVVVGAAGSLDVTLRSDHFELFRTLGGRRSRAQVLAMAWTGDPGPFVDHMSPYGLAARDLVESAGVRTAGGDAG